MKNNISAIRIACFIGLLTIPPIFYVFFSQHFDLRNYENHTLLTINDIKGGGWSEKTKKIEEYYEENVPYKNELTKLNYLFDIEIFKNLDSDSVLLGKDDWLFYKKDNCIDDYCGKLEIAPEQIEDTIKAMEKLEECCRQRGIRLIYFVAPNKETIYGDLYMPEYVKKVQTNNRADMLLNSIRDRTDLEILYPENDLAYYRDYGYQVYRKYDTHWNNIGAYVGADCILRAAGIESVELETLDIRMEGYVSGDLANMIAMGGRYSDDMDYSISNYKPDVIARIIDEREESYLNYAHWNSNVANDQIIMCIGDSFLGAMEEYLAKNYRESYFMHVGNYQSGTIDAVSPDIIVFEIVERSFPSLDILIERILVSDFY